MSDDEIDYMDLICQMTPLELFSIMPGFVFVKDRNSVYQLCNEHLAKIATNGGTVHDVVGKADCDFTWGKDADKFIEIDKRVMELGKRVVDEDVMPLKRKDGHWLQVRTEKIPLKNKKGETVGLMAIAFDITDQKLAEAELREKNKALEEAMRQLKETEIQLLHSERLNALGTLSAELLHEVTNPVQSIYMPLKLLEKMIASKKIDEKIATRCIDDMQAQLKLIADIVASLRHFAKPPSNEDVLEICDLAKVIEKGFALVEYNYDGIIIEKKFDTDCYVKASQSSMMQVLFNLLSNAVKAISEVASPSITIEISADGDTVTFSITDNGSGIDESALSRIFEPFFTTSKNNEGMGMGLSICYGIIKNHHSELKCESKVGEGTKFYFTLPRVPSPQKVQET